MEIKSAFILTGRGQDMIMLHTDLPEPCWPYTGKMAVRFNAAAGGGLEYLRKHFDLPESAIKVVHESGGNPQEAD